jgi:hypothetical protein
LIRAIGFVRIGDQGIVGDHGPLNGWPLTADFWISDTNKTDRLESTDNRQPTTREAQSPTTDNARSAILGSQVLQRSGTARTMRLPGNVG